MRRRKFLSLLGAMVGHPMSALAQARKSPWIIGFLVSGSQETFGEYIDAFRQTFHELGYTDGREYMLVLRWADGIVANIPALADELVRLNPDLLLTSNTAASLALRNATQTIPIISANLTDPIGLGLVSNFAHPGGNVTGFVYTTESPARKQLEAARELIPDITRAGLLFNAPNPSNDVQRQYAEVAAHELGITLVSIGVHRPDELKKAFLDFGQQDRVGVLIVVADLMFLTERSRIGSLALANRLALISTFREHVESGGLLSYGVSYGENFRRAAVYAAKVLQGANVAELPVELPSKIEMVVNLKTASALGLTIPLSLLARADEVIE